jgi:hypothetical protein
MSMPKNAAVPFTPELAEQCRTLVIFTANKYELPPVYLTAHVRNPIADEARKEVWRVMISEMGLKRWQVSGIFGRDRRRVRRSVLGV